MIKRLLSVTILPLVLACFVSTSAISKDLTLNNTPVQSSSALMAAARMQIVEALGKAKSEVLVQAYSFTSKEIAKALVDALKRGVHVEVVLDKSNRNKKGKYSAADFTAHAGIPTFIDSAHAIAHNKVMVIDKEVVITGFSTLRKPLKIITRRTC